MSFVPLEPRRERWSLYLLMAAQFTHIVDFMILMPLGPQLMRTLRIDAGKFGWLVAAYTISAASAGFVATLFLDRFDRRKSFRWLFAGFALATLSCAFAPDFLALLLARIVAGAFGGVTNSLVLAIVSEITPLERRGRALGLIMSGFSIASILGVPAGLALAGDGDWHRPFIVLAVVAALVLFAVGRVLPALPPHPQPGGAAAILAQTKAIATEPNHVRAFTFMIAMSLAAYLVFPYISPSLVANSGYPERWLPLLYMVGGGVTIFATNFAGHAADRFGRLRMFRIAAVASIFPMLAVTHLPVVPMWVSIAAVTLFMSLSSARFVPAMAMITGSVQPRYRAGFMSLNSAFQQAAGGVSVWVASLVVKEDAEKHILHYGVLGWIAAGIILVTLYLGGRVRVAEEISAGHRAPAQKLEPTT